MNNDDKRLQNLHTYFLANISHEFRTPLASLNASIEIFLDEMENLSSAEMAELLASIQLSASGLQTLIDNLLESTTIEMGHFVIRRRPAELNQVIANAVRVMQPLLDRRKQVLTISEPFDVPAIDADPARLTQVFINLISNASKYSPLGETIDVAVRVVGGYLQTEILDRGPGVPTGERSDIFRRFIRTGDSEQHGTGLGLSVVKAIVEGHGGTIQVDDRSGGGAVLRFTIPIHPGQKDAA